MKDFDKILKDRQAAKNEAVKKLETELTNNSIETDRESGNASRALASGERERFTAARIQLDYLQQRRAILQKQLDDLKAAPIFSEKEYDTAVSDLDNEAKAARRKLFTDVFEDLKALQDHFDRNIAVLSEYEKTGEAMARAAGVAPKVDVSRGKVLVKNWIGHILSGNEYREMNQNYELLQ